MTPSDDVFPVGVPLGSDLPPGWTEAYEFAQSALDEACTSCTEGNSQACADLASSLGVHHSTISTTCRTLLGEVAHALDTSSESTRRVVDRIVKDTSDRLFTSAYEIEGSGIGMPSNHDERMGLLSVDPLDWIAASIPAAARFLAGAVPGRGDGNDQRDCEGDPLCEGGDRTGGSGTGPGPTTCYYDDAGNRICPGGDQGGDDGGVVVCDDGRVFPAGTDPAICAKGGGDDDGGGGGDDGGGGGGGGGTGDGGQCCPTDVTTIQNQTVNNYYGTGDRPPPPPPAPPDTCPDPEPPTVNVKVEPKNVVTVNLPKGQAAGLATPPDPTVPRPQPELSWSLPMPCAELDRMATGDGTPGGTGFGQGGRGVSGFWSYLESLYDSTINAVTDAITNVEEGHRSNSGATLSAAGLLSAAGASVSQELLGSMSAASVPQPGAAVYFGTKLAAAGFAEANSHFPATYLFMAERYALQYFNPQYLPSQPNIDILYNLGKIDSEQWACLTKAQGNIPQWAEKVREAMVGRPTIDQIIQLRLRKEITDEQFRERAEKIGWRNETWTSDVFKLATQIPTQSDLLRMMVRDVAREDVVEKYGYDTDFDKAFQGKLKDWSESQGVPAEIFRYFWRAHWQIPSPTQLYAMLQRFRPDRPEVIRWDREAEASGVGGATAIYGPRPYVVTLADVRQALQINDMAPAWIDGLVGISYNPMTRTDAVRAFEIGALTEDDLYHRMRDVGYNESDARTLVDFYVKQANRKSANATGVLTIRKVVRYYKEYAITRGQAEQQLRRVVSDEKRIAALLDGAEFEQVADHTRVMVNLIRKKYLSGLFTQDEAEIELMGQGMQLAQAATLTRRWNEIRRDSPKQATAAQLCNWVRKGLLTVAEYRDRLSRLGWSPIDVDRLSAECFTKR